MLPFTQHNPNHNQNQAAPGGLVPQQVVGGTNNLLPYLMQIQSQMGFVNPQLFDNTNSNFMNIPNFNGHLGNPIMGSSQQIQSRPPFSPQDFNAFGFPGNGQFSNLVGQGYSNSNQFFGWQNQVQQVDNSPLLNLNPSQINALTQLLGCANQTMNHQNAAFLGNSNSQQLGFAQQTNFSQQIIFQQLQNASVAPFNPVVSSHPHAQSSNFQGNHGQLQGLHSSHHQNTNFMNKFKREAFSGRFQKSQDNKLLNSKGEHKPFNINEGKGIIDGVDNSSNQIKTGKRRPLAIYTEKEIQQWREERKKNYPSKANVDKKLAQKQANADGADEAAKLRRQQLKDILAKQAELGFEVPEIPSHYLLDSEHQTHGRDKSRMPLFKGRFQKNGRFQRGAKFERRYGSASKRGTEEDGSSKIHDRYAKKQRVENDDSSKTRMSTREPTLFKKLLSSDIKRDEKRLLQAFRFMVINSFFKDYPEKPFNFPKVLVKDTVVNNDAIEEKSSSSMGELGNVEDHDISDDGDGENDAPQEEGEITD